MTDPEAVHYLHQTSRPGEVKKISPRPAPNSPRPLPNTPGTLLDYLEVLKRRRWTLSTTLLLVVAAVGVWTFLQEPMYRATTTLFVQPNQPSLTGLGEDTPLALSGQFYQTQYEVIKSDTVIRKLLAAYTPDKLPELAEPDPVGRFRKLINVRPVVDSDLVRISIDRNNRDLAVELADKLAAVYIDHSTGDRRSSSNNAFEWLSGQLDAMRAKVEQSERLLLEYKDQDVSVSVERQQALLEERLASISLELNKVTTETLDLETVLAEAGKLLKSPDLVDSLPKALANEQLGRLRNELNDLGQQLAKVSQRYKDQHPQVVSLRSQVEELKRRYAEEKKKVYESVAMEYRISKAKQQSLTASLEASKQESAQMASKAIRYRMLERDAASNRQIYDVLLQRLREADIGGNVSGQNIRVLDAATSPVDPFKPRTGLNILLGLFAGLLAGIGMCFLVDHVDNTIRTEEDIVEMMHESLLGVVPWQRKLDFHNSSREVLRAYESIRTKLRLYSTEQNLRSILVTSAVAAEGKTVTAGLLAMAFARGGFKTLLVDADLFRSDITKRLRLKKPESTLTDYLESRVAFSDVVVQQLVDNLYICQAGTGSTNPANLLSSERMRDFLRDATKTFQVVLVDSPPVSVVLDVAFLGAMVDGVVLVAKSKRASRRLVGNVLTQLRLAQNNVLGVLLTAARISRDSSSHYYGDYYYNTKTRPPLNAAKTRRPTPTAPRVPSPPPSKV